MVTSSRLCAMSLILIFGGSMHVAAQTEVEVTGSGGTPVVMNWKTAEWGPPTSRPGFPEGLRNASIARDPETDGVTYLARFPAGSRFEMHWHTYTETVVILRGAVDINLDGTEHTATEGSYVIIPGGAHHDWRVHPDADVVLLARRDGPPDFNFVER